MVDKEVGLDGFARQEPNGRHLLEESLRRYGFLLMLFGGSIIVMLTIGSSTTTTTTNGEHALLGFSVLIFGAVLLILSDFRGWRAAERFAGQVVEALDDFFGQR